MNEITFNPNSRVPLDLGKQYDHNETRVTFEGFDCDSANTVYFKLETTSNKWLIPLSNLSWTVTNPFTQTAGTFRGQLVEIASDNSLVSNSAIFKVKVSPSVYADEDYEVKDPTLDLWATRLTDLYNTIYEHDETYTSNERVRKANEGERQLNETTRQTNAESAIANLEAEIIKVENKLANGDFNGADGTSPTVSLSKSDGVTTLSITDVDGTHTEQIKDGSSASYDDSAIKERISAIEGKESTWDAKSDFSGNYEDLTNKPTIPTVPTEEIEANTSARHTHSNKAILDKIDKEPIYEHQSLEAYRKSANQDTIDTEIKESISDKLTEPTGAKVGQLFKVASIDDNGHYVLEAVDYPTIPVSDVQVNSTTIVDENGVANVPIANASGDSLGVAMFQSFYGIAIDKKTGQAYIYPATTAKIDSRGDYMPIVPANLVYAVDSVLCSTSTSEALSDTEKANACERLGAVYKDEEFELIEEFTTSEAGKIYKYAEPDATPYNFKKLLLYIEAPSGTQTTNQLCANGSGWNYVVVNMGTTVVASGNRYSAFLLEIKGNRLVAFGGSGSKYTIDNYFGTSPQALLLDYTSISSIYTIYDYPSGTNVKIYAIRA